MATIEFWQMFRGTKAGKTSFLLLVFFLSGVSFSNAAENNGQDSARIHYQFVSKRYDMPPTTNVMSTDRGSYVRDDLIRILGGISDRTQRVKGELGNIEMPALACTKVTVTNDKTIAVGITEATRAHMASGGVDNRGQVQLNANTLSDIFDQAINSSDMVEATGVVAHDGVIELVSANPVENEGMNTVSPAKQISTSTLPDRVGGKAVESAEITQELNQMIASEQSIPAMTPLTSSGQINGPFSCPSTMLSPKSKAPSLPQNVDSPKQDQ